MAYIGRQLGQGVRNRFIYTATAGQTTFSGSDDNGGTLVYTDGTYVDVNLNGVELVSGTDYTATSGTSIVLTTGASLNDTLSITVYDVFAVADTVSAQNGGTFSGDVNVNGDLAVDTNTLFVDASANSVGIGTSSPDELLHVNNSSQNSYVYMSGGGGLGESYGGFVRGYGVAGEGGHLELGVVDANTKRIAVEVTQQGNEIIFNTAGTERARIDSSGRVTKPYQPCFEVYNNGSDFTVTANTKITCFQGERFDVGGVYNTSNQRFTAPVSGKYLFGMHLRMGAPGSVRIFRVELRVNGSYNTDLATTGGGNNFDGSTGFDHPQASGTTLLNLSAGDYIELYTANELSSSNTLYIQNGHRSHWWGMLVS